MPDPLRNDAARIPTPTNEIGLDTQSIDELLAGFPSDRELPPAENARLTRTVESIGAALGSTVGKMRSGLSLVQNRRREMSEKLSHGVSRTTENLSATMLEKASEIGDVAEEKASKFYSSAQQQWEQLNRTTRERVLHLRRRTAALRDEYPLEVIGGFAAAGFVLGVALRIWRSNHD